MAIVRSEPVEVDITARPAINPPSRRKLPLKEMTEDSSPSEAPEGAVLVRMTGYGETHLRQVRIPVPVIEGPPAKVRVSGGATKSVGGYEFVRIDVSVELPCQPNADDLDYTYVFASEKVAQYLSYEMGLADGAEDLEGSR